MRTICEKQVTVNATGNFKTYIAIELSAQDLLAAYNERLSNDERLRIDYDYEKFKETFEAEMNKLGSRPIRTEMHQTKPRPQDRGFVFPILPQPSLQCSWKNDPSLGVPVLFLAVGLGAFGAHALKALLSTDALAQWHTAVHYQFYHGLGLRTVGRLGSADSSGTVGVLGRSCSGSSSFVDVSIC